MAKVYVHKKRGFQVRFTLYFPDGSFSVRYRYLPTSALAEAVRRDCEFLERGSRSGSLNSREIVQARHDGLLSEVDARSLSGGRIAALYDLDKIKDQYLTTIKISHSPVAYNKASFKAAWIIGWLQYHPIPTLTAIDIKQYILDRRSGAVSFRNARSGYTCVGVKPKTIKNELDIMKGLINEAVAMGMVSENVVKTISLPVKTSILRRSLNRDEVTRLISGAYENKHLLHGQLYEFVMVALFTGFRLSELRTLTWKDINLETRRVFVQSKEISEEDDFNTKSGEARFQSIADALVPVLTDMERRGRFVFGGDAPYLSEVITAVIKKVMARSGLPSDLSLHHLRHTYGSWLLRITGDLKFVQNKMGHLSIATTQNYMHNIEDRDDPVRAFRYD